MKTIIKRFRKHVQITPLLLLIITRSVSAMSTGGDRRSPEARFNSGNSTIRIRIKRLYIRDISKCFTT